ncbi:MAG: hypothetical protein KIT48_18690 [Pseudolabrys sp.]|nr:hypothetical protein [Pseudolabrys sp.]
MTSTIAAARTVLSRIASGDRETVRAVLRIGGKAAVLVLMALMIAAYAASASQSTPPPSEPVSYVMYS